MNIKSIIEKEGYFCSGYRTCSGCGIPILVRIALSAAQEISKNIVIANATGCLEVTTTIYPYTAWKVPYIHNAFENAASTISGVEAAYKALKKKGKLDEEVIFIAIGGDGGTYDIGLQALSGAVERGHKFLYICYNNQAYQNTGNQRSSATPFKAITTTSPLGKQEFRKSMVEIMGAHRIYSAQSAIHNFSDLAEKVKKGLEFAPSYLEVLIPCPTNWKFDTSETIEISKLATETCFWPLYEIYPQGKYVVNYKPAKKLPVEEFLRKQGRFKLLRDEEISFIQEHIDKEWKRLLNLEEKTKDFYF